MLNPTTVASIADDLLAAYEGASTLPPITESRPELDVDGAHDVLAELGARRRAAGWIPVGRKIGFTNRTIWAADGVDAPMWAHVWDRTVVDEPGGQVAVDLTPFVQPRIEPEVVFGLRGPVPVTDDPCEVLAAVEWMAPGFEIVQCHYPDWRFTLPDCTASFALHARLVVGRRVVIDQSDRKRLAAVLASFEATLTRDGLVIDRGVGSNVLGSPALALAHLAEVLDRRPEWPALTAGELITTGTITDAAPLEPGHTWTSSYGELGLEGLTITT
jgi:2-oxo-3-hexenedioate decarboxylase